jgi:AraC-like DNA-binding protein
VNGYGLFPELLMVKDYQPEVNAYYYKEWKAFEMPFHTHEAAEIMYVIDGVCIVELLSDRKNNNEVTLKKGEFIILNGSVPHRLLVSDTCRMLNIEFRFTISNGLFPSMKQLAEQEESLAALFRDADSFLVLREFQDIHHVLRSLVFELDASSTGLELMVQILLAQLLIRIARLHQENMTKGATGVQGMYVQQCIEYLQQNYDRNVQVKDVAESINLHPGYLQRVFKLKTGTSIMHYLNNFRMEKTQMLLRQTEIPISEIADYVGISSRQYLHMMFKKHTGMTPVQYRKSSPTGSH